MTPTALNCKTFFKALIQWVTSTVRISAGDSMSDFKLQLQKHSVFPLKNYVLTNMIWFNRDYAGPVDRRWSKNRCVSWRRHAINCHIYRRGINQIPSINTSLYNFNYSCIPLVNGEIQSLFSPVSNVLGWILVTPGILVNQSKQQTQTYAKASKSSFIV